MRKRRIRDIAYISLSAAFVAVCSWIAVPTAVPFTLQSFGVWTIAALLGGKRGTWAIFIYIALGAAGIPVYSMGRGGIGMLLGETGGYLMGFLAGAFICGTICEKTKSTAALMGAMLLGNLICYICGSLWGGLVYLRGETNLRLAFVLGRYVIPFVVPDLAKALLATAVVKAIWRRRLFTDLEY